MSRDLRAVLYYFAVDIRFSLLIFWSILLSSLVVLYVAAVNTNGMVMGSTSLAIYIFCGISGYLMTKENFPFCIKFGATRDSFILGASVFNGLFALFMAISNLVVNFIFYWLVQLGNVQNFKLMYNMGDLNTQMFQFKQFGVDIVLCFMLLSVGFFIGSIFYRLGLIGGGTTIALLLLMLFIPSTRDMLHTIFITSGTELDLNYVSIVILSILVIIPNWLLLKKASTTPGLTR